MREKQESRRSVITLMMYDAQQEQSSNLANIINHLGKKENK